MWIVPQQQKNMLSNTYKTGLRNKIVGEKCEKLNRASLPDEIPSLLISLSVHELYLHRGHPFISLYVRLCVRMCGWVLRCVVLNGEYMVTYSSVNRK